MELNGLGPAAGTLEIQPRDPPESARSAQSRIDDLHASGARPNITKPNTRFARFRKSPKQHQAECQLSTHPEPSKTGFEAPRMAGQAGRQAVRFWLRTWRKPTFPRNSSSGEHFFTKKTSSAASFFSMDDGEACVILSFFAVCYRTQARARFWDSPAGISKTSKKLHSNEWLQNTSEG